MSKKRISKASKDRTDWDQLDALTDDQVRAGIKTDADAQPTDETFWNEAKVVMPEPKETITIRIDPDVLEWLRKKGKGYQTRINAILRSYMRAHQD